ncbi:Intersectin-2 [Frankliniella fusca]|uniref:Intersectin-2 n=1 Tax=Frankliniella fusca TaxID=407009 RepID=A0AAE1HDV0_9NEOP|nr:Intersectin-2 [Frankliniella fusca]
MTALTGARYALARPSPLAVSGRRFPFRVGNDRQALMDSSDSSGSSSSTKSSHSVAAAAAAAAWRRPVGPVRPVHGARWHPEQQRAAALCTWTRSRWPDWKEAQMASPFSSLVVTRCEAYHYLIFVKNQKEIPTKNTIY